MEWTTSPTLKWNERLSKWLDTCVLLVSPIKLPCWAWPITHPKPEGLAKLVMSMFHPRRHNIIHKFLILHMTLLTMIDLPFRQLVVDSPLVGYLVVHCFRFMLIFKVELEWNILKWSLRRDVGMLFLINDMMTLKGSICKILKVLQED